MTAFAAPNKRLGQHFLHDPHVVSQIVRAFAPSPDDNVVEIGPGRGVLTRALLQQLDRLSVIELDRELANWLRESFEQRAQITVHQGDALKFDFAQLATEKPLRVIGNLPYQISTPLLFHLLKQRDRISDMCFMLQKEVVDRMLAQPGTSEYGRLTVMLACHCRASRVVNVPPGAFNPPPKVHSAVVQLHPRQAHEELVKMGSDTLFADIVRRAFSARRKTIRNGLKGLVTVDQLEQAGISSDARPETLAAEQFARITHIIS